MIEYALDILFASKTYREVKNNSASSNDSYITFKASTVEPDYMQGF
jgi:hypothetical protein